MKESIINNIKSLPPLSKTVQEINAIYSDENGTVSQMAKVIEKDPMVAANLLKAANSPLYGFKKEIDSISQAVSLFGMTLTRSIVISNSLRKLLNVDIAPYGISSDEFAEISADQAAFGYRWFAKFDKADAQKIHLLAFLQETGKILIASSIIEDDMAEQFKSEIEFTNDIASVERSFVDTSTSFVSAAVFEHWKFDEEFVDTIRYVDTPNESDEKYKKLTQALHVIKSIIPVNKPFADSSMQIGVKKAGEFGFDTEVLKEALDEYLKDNFEE